MPAKTHIHHQPKEMMTSRPPDKLPGDLGQRQTKRVQDRLIGRIKLDFYPCLKDELNVHKSHDSYRGNRRCRPYRTPGNIE